MIWAWFSEHLPVQFYVVCLSEVEAERKYVKSNFGVTRYIWRFVGEEIIKRPFEKMRHSLKDKSFKTQQKYQNNVKVLHSRHPPKRHAALRSWCMIIYSLFRTRPRKISRQKCNLAKIPEIRINTQNVYGYHEIGHK